MTTLRDQYPIDERAIKMVLPSSIFLYVIIMIFFGWWLFIGIAAIAGFLFGAGSFFVMLLIGILLVIPGWLVFYLCIRAYTKAYYRTFFYDIKDGTIIMRKGVFMPRETSLLLAKINDVNLQQDILSRWYGLSTVNFSTASDQSSLRSFIPGLSQENAAKLRDTVLEQIKKQA